MPFNFYDSVKKALGIKKNFNTNISTTLDMIDVNIQNGVPPTFSKVTSNASTVQISKGSLNKITFVPRILNEHVESSRAIHSVVTAANIVGQIFKASKDNISSLMLTLESAAGVVIDNFESYIDNAALQAVWVTSGANLALLDQVIFFPGGSKAMRLTTTVDGEEWTRTSAPQDFTGYTGTFNSYFSHDSAQLQVSVFIEDSAGFSKSFTIIQDGAGIWCNCEVNEAAMIEDGAWVTNVADIDTIGYRVVLKRPASFVVIDNLTSVPPPGEMDIRLRDMGTELPEDGVTSLDDGVLYPQIGASESDTFTLQLQGGKRLYHLEDFFAGVNKSVPGNDLININHYYILELLHVDTDVSVYGPDTSFGENYYISGYAFTAPDDVTAISAIGEFSDIMFGIMSTQDVYFTEVGWRFNADPNGNSSILVFLEDIGMKITDIIVDHETSPEREFNFDTGDKSMFLADGGKLEFYYNDDFSDSVQHITGEAKFRYEPPVVNG